MNTKNELLRQAEGLQAEALEVIEILGLRTRWEAVGETIMVGSARFGLMMSPNIDYEIYVDAPDARVGFGAISDIAAHPNVSKVEYHNFMNTSDPGLYWHLFYDAANGRQWDIDMWLVPNSHPNAGMADALASAMSETLTEPDRLRILEIKNNLPPDASARGVDIYKAVIQDGVTDVQGFLGWLRATPPPEMETWRPGMA